MYGARELFREARIREALREILGDGGFRKSLEVQHECLLARPQLRDDLRQPVAFRELGLTAGRDDEDACRFAARSEHGNDAHMGWSPDGEQIVFASSRMGFKDEAIYTDAPQPYGELFVMRADGTNVQQLTDNQWEEGTPAFQPTRRQLSSR